MLHLKGFLFLFSWLMYFSCYAQSIYSGVIFDSNTNEPIPYADIILDSSVYHTDVNGSFSLHHPGNDTLLVSRIGYQPLAFYPPHGRDTLYLKPFQMELLPVSIRADRKTMETGYHNEKTIGTTGQRFTTLTTLIQPAGNLGIIKNVLVHMKNQEKGTDYIISIFENGTNNKPGKLIHTQSFKSTSGRNSLTFNISEASIELPEKGVFVSVKVNPGQEENKSLMRLTKTSGKPISYFLYLNQWFENDNLNPDYNLTYKIGLEVLVY